MGWMAIWWIGALVLIVAVVWSVLRSTLGSTGNRVESPEKTLKRRYASGEIDRESYERMSNGLKR